MTALTEAARLVGDVRAERLVAGDQDTAERLSELVRILNEENEYLDGIVKFDLPMTNRSYPPGAALGWLLMHDPHVRRLRQLRGLPVPQGGQRVGHCEGGDEL